MVTYQRRLCLIYNILGECISCGMFKVKYEQENTYLHIFIVIHLKFKEHHINSTTSFYKYELFTTLGNLIVLIKKME